MGQWEHRTVLSTGQGGTSHCQVCTCAPIERSSDLHSPVNNTYLPTLLSMFSSSLRTAPRHVLPAYRTLRSFSPSPRSYLYQGPAGTSVAIEVPLAHTSTKMGLIGTRTSGVEYCMFRRRHVRLDSRACLDGDNHSKDTLLLQGRYQYSRPGSGNAYSRYSAYR